MNIEAPLQSNIRPFFMWAGGKSKMLKKYETIWPHSNYDMYIEPFLGGASVFSWLCNQSDTFKHIVLNDINVELIGLFKTVKDNPAQFIIDATALARKFLCIHVDNKQERKKFFYELRTSYWSEPTTAKLYILMRLAFNGIWQTCIKSHGLFGTPAGLLNQTRIKQIVDKELIMQWHHQLNNVSFCATDYAQLLFNANNSLIYLDPPYRDSFTTYSVDFDDDEQRRLCDWSIKQANHGATVLLANRDAGDDFFEHILGDRAEFHYFDVVYTAGRRKKETNGYSAKQAREFLAIIK